MLLPGVRSYEEDKEALDELRQNARATFEFGKRWNDQVLARLADPDYQDKIEDICNLMNQSREADPEDIAESHRLLGQWFADYIRDAGYNAQINPTVLKQMILVAFPTINPDGKLTPDNVEQVYLITRRVLNTYLDVKKSDKYSLRNLLGNGGAPVYFS